MKNLHILLFSALLVANPIFSQINQTRSIISTLSVEKTNQFETPQLRSGAQADTSVIWCEDFANGLTGNNNSNLPWSVSGTDGALWLHDTDGPSGQYSSNLGPLASTTPNNGWMIFDADLSNPGTVQAQYVQRTGQLISPYIDLSEEPNVSLRFDHGYRWCCSNDHQLLVGVSNDQGQTWTEYQVNENAVTNELVAITQTTIVISDVAGEQDSVLIRFEWGAESAASYFWMVDDVTIIETPANAVRLENVDASLPNTLFGAASYTSTPLLQAQVSGYFFGGNIVNEGVNDLVNARVEGEVTTNNFSSQSESVTTLSTSEDTLIFTQNGFMPPSTGTYTANVFCTDDNNVMSSTSQISFNISEYEYARDQSDFNNAFGFSAVNNGGSGQLGNEFQIFDDQDIYAVRAFIDMSTDPNATAIATLTLYDGTNYTFQDESSIVNVGQFRGQWANFVFPTPFITTEGQSLIASIRADGGEGMVVLGSSGVSSFAGSFLHDIDGTQQNQGANIWFTTANIPMVRLSFDPSLGEEETEPTDINEEFLSDFSVYPNPNNGVFSLEIETKNSADILVSVSNVIGQEVYNRQLSNVSQFKDEIDISTLQSGIYILRLYDDQQHVIANEKLIVR